MADNEVPKKGAVRAPNDGKGRPKGAINKHTAELKEMILQALDRSGGVDYLVERANDPRTASSFLSLVGKTLPMTVKGPGENGEHVFKKIVVEVVGKKE
jgi:hypothetical protein